MFNRLYLWSGKVGANAACNYWSNLGSVRQVPISAGWTEAVWNMYEVCRTLLHMTSAGNWTPDLLILSQMPYPLSHVFPQHTLSSFPILYYISFCTLISTAQTHICTYTHTYPEPISLAERAGLYIWRRNADVPESLEQICTKDIYPDMIPTISLNLPATRSHCSWVISPRHWATLRTSFFVWDTPPQEACSFSEECVPKETLKSTLQDVGHFTNKFWKVIYWRRPNFTVGTW